MIEILSLDLEYAFFSDLLPVYQKLKFYCVHFQNGRAIQNFNEDISKTVWKLIDV